jgi:hypothetical protein
MILFLSSSLCQLSQTRARGLIWWKSLLSLGGDGKFHSCFAVIEKGLLTFYRSEEVSFLLLSCSLALYPHVLFSAILCLCLSFEGIQLQ